MFRPDLVVNNFWRAMVGKQKKGLAVCTFHCCIPDAELVRFEISEVQLFRIDFFGHLNIKNLYYRAKSCRVRFLLHSA